MHEPQEQFPIALCHPACSGGSIIYRYLVSTFGWWGISEVGHQWLNRLDLFQPVDPELQLIMNGYLPESKLEDTLWERIERCHVLAQSHRTRLLVREHTHQYHFDDQPPRTGACSWFAERWESEHHARIPILVSVRDPVDCWLGMQYSFPDLVKYDFAEYCRRYERWLNIIDEQSTSAANIHMFRYEDFVQDPAKSVEQIAEFVGVKPRQSTGSEVGQVKASGNSGRQSHVIKPRPRRSFSLGLVKSARATPEYAALCQRLNYPHIAEDYPVASTYVATVQQFCFSAVRPMITGLVPVVRRRLRGMRT
jgi:hypothetical protein